ncbi:hypothetical protein F4680DRAFT_320843 [Xylaria scruposa]|nr:hypothetical protein F4680DRAFT_320843 [Xylaria scruposa]
MAVVHRFGGVSMHLSFSVSSVCCVLLYLHLIAVRYETLLTDESSAVSQVPSFPLPPRHPSSPPREGERRVGQGGSMRMRFHEPLPPLSFTYLPPACPCDHTCCAQKIQNYKMSSSSSSRYLIRDQGPPPLSGSVYPIH